MTADTLLQSVTPLPPSPYGEKAIETLRAAAEKSEVAGQLQNLLSDNQTADFISAALGDCPFFLDLACKNISRFLAILERDPAGTVDAVIDSIRCGQFDDRQDAMAALRRAKQSIALTVGLADLARAADLESITGSLTDFADAALDAALRYALQEAERQGKWDGTPLEESGLVIIGMGKYGAHELNYSSDIDIIAFYDAAAPGLKEGQEHSVFWVRVIRLLVQLMQEHTADGYVFRTDLRLRPDPGATPVALSIDGALQYYESMGQNWERAALIKARAVAGNITCGERFLAEISPFIWRRYLDFAAIADIHSIKRQIHAHRGHGTVRVAGHDLKRGRGGIREIEFFAQTQQLIAGGRDLELRGRKTRDMLSKLCKHGWIDDEVRAALDEAYVWFRNLEHRLQMVRDEQTQTIPEDSEELSRIGRLCGFADVNTFRNETRGRLNMVATRYADLFEDEPALSAEGGNLVFTGDDDDPATLETLSRMGFSNPAYITKTIRAWHFGRFPAMRSAAARENLTTITPALLKAFADGGDGDAAVRSFDAILRGLPTGVQLFALLSARRELLDLLAMILSAAPKMAEAFARQPKVVAALIDPGSYDSIGDKNALSIWFDESLGQATGIEDILDRARLFASEQRFLISVRLLTRTAKPREVGIAFSELADLVTGRLLHHVEQEFIARHGSVPGGKIAILALGRLGSCEMTATSDLDLIVIYDHDPDATASDGERPLAPSQYYARLTQRLLAALSAPTAEGIAYEVDLRLRPSGKSGPLATQVDGFERYQSEEAWTWEHLALSRARAIAGDETLCTRVEDYISETVAKERDAAKLKADVLDMRGRVQKERGEDDPWSMKTVPGGLIDVEFAAQYAVLSGLERQVGEPTYSTLLRAAEHDRENSADWRVLAEASEFQGALTQLTRCAYEGRFLPDDAPETFKAYLARQMNEPDFSVLSAKLTDLQASAEQSFLQIMENGADCQRQPL